jgi:hypothetical protein
MIVQASNTAYDIHANRFSLAVSLQQERDYVQS